MSFYHVSAVDNHTGQWLGCLITAGHSDQQALEKIHQHGVPRCAEVVGYPLEPEQVPQPQWRDRLLTLSEMEQAYAFMGEAGNIKIRSYDMDTGETLTCRDMTEEDRVEFETKKRRPKR